MLLRSPILLHYYLTYRCNCACRFCDIWQSDTYNRNDFADPAQVRDNLKQGKKLGLRFVDFTGGEPLLHPQLPELLDYANSQGYTTSVTTNTLLYPKLAEQLRGKIRLLHFSIDSLDPQQHDDIRGKHVFQSLMNAIDVALSLGETPDLLYTVTPQNIDQLPALARFARKLKIILIVNPVFSHIQQHNLSDMDLDRIERYRKLPYVYINQAFVDLRRAGGNDNADPRCRVTSSTLVISPDNHLLLPCFHHYKTSLPIEGDLYNLYKSRRISEERDMDGRYDFCSGCVLNCYMDPSFLYKSDALFYASIWSKTQYAWYKYFHRPVSQWVNTKPAAAGAIAEQIREGIA